MPGLTAPTGDNVKRRSPVNKRRSAKQFRKSVGRTKSLNVKPMRGGYRL